MGARKVGRGWAAVLGLTLVVAALSAVPVGVLIFVPLGLLLVGLAFRRPALLALGVVCAAVGLVGSPTGPLWYLERGWALVLGAWFLVMVLALPRAAFLSRALGALVASIATVAAVVAVARGEWTRLDVAFAGEFRNAAGEVATVWGTAGELGDELAQLAFQAAELQARVYPAMTALASLAALGIGWWAYRRVADGEAKPLGTLREFRFRDELVWLFIAGVALLLVPVGELSERAGSNLVLFMGALYALRGAGVLLTLIGGIGPLGALLGGLVLVLLYPLVMGAALVIGLTDTWLDFRTRRRRAERPS